MGSKNDNLLISFIIPVYNEEFNIQGVLEDLYSALLQHPRWSHEIILIEDGSKDGTKNVVQSLAHRYPDLRVIYHETNQGYNVSMRDGMAVARGAYIMYIGADEEFDMSELASFIDPLRLPGLEGPEVVLGVRWQRNAYRLHRFFLSVIYIFLLNAMFKMRVNDYNWSQVWSRRLLDSIEIESRSLFMLPEIIIKAHDLKFQIKEVPSNHRGRKTGRSSLNFQIMAKALGDAFRFWVHRRSRSYSPAKAASTANLRVSE